MSWTLVRKYNYAKLAEDFRRCLIHNYRPLVNQDRPPPPPMKCESILLSHRDGPKLKEKKSKIVLKLFRMCLPQQIDFGECFFVKTLLLVSIVKSLD